MKKVEIFYIYFIDAKSISETKSEEFKEVLKIDDEFEKETMKNKNYDKTAANPNEIDIDALNLLDKSIDGDRTNTKTENEQNQNKEKNNNNDFMNFSIEDIKKSKKNKKLININFISGN